MAAANVVILMSSVHTQTSGTTVGDKLDPLIVILSLVLCSALILILWWQERK